MAQYKNVTKDEMADHLEPQGFMPMSLPGTVELVWGKIVRKDGTVISMRIYTGINPNGESRDVGKDAIRVELWYRNADGEICRVGGSKRVHRVEGWAKNLQNRIDDWQEQLGPLCQKCGAPTALRKPKKNATWKPFYGCTQYPACDGTATA
jgi:hypothetical protein